LTPSQVSHKWWSTWVLQSCICLVGKGANWLVSHSSQEALPCLHLSVMGANKYAPESHWNMPNHSYLFIFLWIAMRWMNEEELKAVSIWFLSAFWHRVHSRYDKRNIPIMRWSNHLLVIEGAFKPWNKLCMNDNMHENEEIANSIT
jgi:hypothetical protein